MKRGLLGLGLLWLAVPALPAFARDTVYYYYTNMLHSSVVETDAQGKVIERTYYVPYGQVLNRSMRDGPGYTGHEEDPATGLVYMQQRYYGTESGRFFSIDPVLPDGDGGSFNRYWYAGDNPYRYTDPDGRMFGFDDLAGIFVGAIVNTTITVAQAEATGQPITPGDLAGAAVSGAIEGEGLVNAPETGGLTAAMAYAGAAGAAGNAAKQAVNELTGYQTSSFSMNDVIEDGLAGATIGALTHGIPDTRIPGLSSGCNNMRAVGNALRTKIANGTAGQMSMKTAMKATIGSQAANLGRKATGTSIENNAGHPLSITITCPANTKPEQPCG